MGKMLAAFFLLCFSSIAFAQAPHYQEENLHNTTGTLNFVIFDPAKLDTMTGICSGTFVGVKTILTATHCLNPGDKSFKFDGEIAGIVKRFDDGNDHTLLLTDMTATYFAVFGSPPKQGDDIFYWGNPRSLPGDILRRGYIAGYDRDATVYDVHGLFGDSGAAIFDKNGKIIGVISYITQDETFSMMGSYPLAFTREQVIEAEVATHLVNGKPIPNAFDALTSGKKVPEQVAEMKD